MKNYIDLIGLALLILILGFITGYTMGYFKANSNVFPELKYVKDINCGVSTIKLMSIENNVLKGENSNYKSRIVFSNNQNGILELKENEKFSINLNEINLKNYYKSSEIPKNVLFISSKQGKYYYSVLNQKSTNIKAKNRIYFYNEEDAIKAGYKKR